MCPLGLSLCVCGLIGGRRGGDSAGDFVDFYLKSSEVGAAASSVPRRGWPASYTVDC